MTAIQSSTQLEVAIGELLAPWDSLDTPGWAVAVVRDGEPIVRVCRGMASVEHAAPITPATVFSMASISKQFVCASILVLEERGRLDLDDDVRLHVPELPDYDQRITLRHLMTNQSGLRDFEGLLDLAGFRFGLPLGHDEVMALICRQNATVCPPDEEYLYCNTGFRLLAVVVERVTGRPWSDFLADELLAPIGMERSHVCVDRRALERDLADAHDKRSNGYRALDGLLPVYAAAESGESGLYSTLDDMTLWALAFQGVGPAATTVSRLATTHPLSTGAAGAYGYGVFSFIWGGHRVVRHSGGMPGVHSEILHLPDERLTVVCLANHEDLAPTLMARRVIAAIVGDLQPEFVPTLPESLAGRFVDDATGIVIETGTRPDPAFVFDWGVNFDEVGAGRLSSFGRWLSLELPTHGERPTTTLAASLGGRPLHLRRVDLNALPPDGLAGRYRSAELDADWVIEPDADGRLALAIDGSSGRMARGWLTGGGPDLAIAVEGSLPWGSLRIDRDDRGRAEHLTIATAAVRGVRLTRAD